MNKLILAFFLDAPLLFVFRSRLSSVSSSSRRAFRVRSTTVLAPNVFSLILLKVVRVLDVSHVLLRRFGLLTLTFLRCALGSVLLKQFKRKWIVEAL